MLSGVLSDEASHLDGKEPGGQGESKWLGTLWDDSLEFFFPTFCGLCKKRTEREWRRFGVCEGCFRTMEAPSPRCYRCSAPLPASVGPQTDCIHCKKEKWRFTRAICLGKYQDRLRTAVILMKRPFFEHLSMGLGNALADYVIQNADVPYDLVVPTPQHWMRRVMKRTNSSELLSEPIAKRLNIPLRRTCLVRVRMTKKQGMLGGEQRRINVKSAFRIGRRSQVEGNTILLVDDILTSGSTANEMARQLLQAGASRVDVAALARSLG